jgi:HSP20 family molecular chaperone IbpA
MNQAAEVTEGRSKTPATAESSRRLVHAPRVDVRETSDAFHVVADLPGVDQDGVEVTVERDVLSIVARTKREAPEGYRRVYGPPAATEYRRAFTLSEKIDRDGIQATLKLGRLSLTVPKAREALPRRISIQAA